MQVNDSFQAATSAATSLPVAVLGAGPVGLAAAAHLLERGIEPIVFEAGESVGANLLDYGHVRLFSPWRYNIDQAVTRQLKAAGWAEPAPNDLPLARDIVERVLQPFAALPEVAPRLRLAHRVVSVTREGFDKVKTAGRERAPFVVRIEHAGVHADFRARAVLDATGTWTQPNPLGASGLPAIGEEELRTRIVYGIPDVLGSQRARYAGKQVLVVGAGHSAANALLALAELASSEPSTRLVWALRGKNPARAFGGGAADALAARGELGLRIKALADGGRLELITEFRVTALSTRDGTVMVFGLGPNGERREIAGVDEIVCATGQRPDLAIASELRIRLDQALESTEALGPLIDPNVHSCGTVRPHGHRALAHPEAGFYTLGVKSYGRAPTFLMATGYEQARSVVAAVAGDLEAADRVELDLPETGVCGVPDFSGAATLAEAAPVAPARACCGPAKASPTAEVQPAPVTAGASSGCASAQPPTIERVAVAAAAPAKACCG